MAARDDGAVPGRRGPRGALFAFNEARELTLRELREDAVGIKRPVYMKLDAETYREFKRKVYGMGLTVRDVFEEFAQMVVIGDDMAERVVESLRQRQALECVDTGAEKFVNAKKRADALLDYIANQQPSVEFVEEEYE